MPTEKLSEAYRITTEKAPYAMLLNEVLQTVKNTDALAIWVYLQSMPSTWVLVKSHICERFDLGRDRYYKAMEVLRDAGLVTYVIGRDGTGKIVSREVHVAYKPHCRKTDNEANPHCGETAPYKENMATKETLIERKQPSRGKKGYISVEQWQEQTSGELIPDGHISRVTAKKIGLSDDFVDLALDEMIDRNAGGDKKYKDWGLTLNNAVRGNWYNLWFKSHEDNSWYLTTAGKSRQAMSQAEA